MPTTHPSAAREEGQWRPIATAPQDWSCVILYSEMTGEVFAGYYSCADGGEDRWIAYHCMNTQSEDTVTHWQPLPEPPPVRGT